MAVLGYLPKLKRGGPGIAFGVHFLHDFSKKCSLFNILSIVIKFQCHNFFASQDIIQNVLLKSYLDN